jgi:DNA adenine methylase
MQKAVNVSTVPQRSLFRYPGGKTWLIPQVRRWLAAHGGKRIHLIEPFAGSGIVSLTAVVEGLVKQATMIELDPDVSAVWRAVLGQSGAALARQVRDFDFNEANALDILSGQPGNLRERAFQTLVKNRVRRNGILADGAGILREGEAGGGLNSRWYPDTIADRILEIVKYKDRITFRQGDGIRVLRKYTGEKNTIFFIDPPYAPVGERLYNYFDIDHDKLFDIAEGLKGDFLITYNRTTDVQALVRKHHLHYRSIRMNGGSNEEKMELLIGRNLDWLPK